MIESKELSFEEQVKLVKNSKLLHKKWYAETYKDVKILGMDAAEHYLKYGARLGRDPGKTFETNFYLDTYKDVKESGLNPLIHYVFFGQNEGRFRNSKSLIPAAKSKKSSRVAQKATDVRFYTKTIGGNEGWLP